MRQLIGCDCTIIASGNPTLVGIDGTIVEETKNMLVIKTKDGEKQLIKNTITLQINGETIEGKTLMGTAAERIKRKK